MRPLTPRRLVSLLVLPLLATLLPAATGCGLLSSDDEPLAGGYESRVFRVQSQDGTVLDLGADGASLEMTLARDGALAGRLFVPASANGVIEAIDESFTGSYQQSGDGVTFTFDDSVLSDDYFDTGTPLDEITWRFFRGDDLLTTDSDVYALALRKTESAEEVSGE